MNDVIIDLDGKAAGSAPEEGRVESGGEGTPSPTDYAGFQTPEELAKAYQVSVKELNDFRSLKGKMGNELGNLKSEKARLEGMLEVMQKAKASPTIGMDDLQKQLDNGDLNLSQFISKSNELMREEYDKRLDEKISTFQSQADRKAYIDQFIKDNPGYVEAYNDGRLSKWIDRGISGEEAWANFKAEQSTSELDTLKETVKTLEQQLKEAGVKVGTQLEKGKSPASKVLGPEGDGASFRQTAKEPITYRTNTERLDAGLAVLEKMRREA